MSKAEKLTRGALKPTLQNLQNSGSRLGYSNPKEWLTLDPKSFYSLKAAKLADEATGLELLAYKIFGSDLIGSLALAIDPLSKFAIADTRITPVNRTRTFTAMGTPWARKRRHKEIQIIGRSPPNILTPDPFDREAYSESVTVPSNTTVSLTAQSQVLGTIKDTTYRTRPIGSDQGEFELWKPRVRCKPASRQRISLESNVYTTAGGYTYRSRDASFMSDFTVGPAARITPSTLDALYASERTSLLNVMGNNAISMVSRTSPRKTEFSLTRSIIELRDLPRSLRGTTEAFVLARDLLSRKRRLRPRQGKTIPSEYVNLQFGWLPIYRDIMSMLSLPERISRRVNRLMSRVGQDSTFRGYMDLGISPISSPPSFTFDLLTGESLVSTATHGFRKTELRGMINANVKLPDLKLPILRRELMRDAWGLYPDPVDVYNLTPWSWLADWFTGLGDYVEAFNLINTDPSIINYGFLTGIATLQIDTVHTSKATRVQKVSLTPPVPATVITENIDENLSRTARVEATLQIRRTFGSAYGLRPTSDLTLFSGGQLAILGALLAMRI